MEATLTFACMVCQKRMAVPTEMAGKPVRCPHCREISIAPGATVDHLPEFSKPPEAADSILADPGELEDSVFPDEGSHKRLEQPAAPPPVPVPPPPFPMPQQPQPNPAYAQPPQPTYTAPPPGYGPPLMPAQPFPMPQAPVYYPPVQPLPAPAPLPDSAILDDPPTPRRQKPAAAPLPIKEIIIGMLAMYSLVITVVAIAGWMRSTQVITKPAAEQTNKTKSGKTK